VIRSLFDGLFRNRQTNEITILSLL